MTSFRCSCFCILSNLWETDWFTWDVRKKWNTQLMPLMMVMMMFLLSFKKKKLSCININKKNSCESHLQTFFFFAKNLQTPCTRSYIYSICFLWSYFESFVFPIIYLIKQSFNHKTLYYIFFDYSYNFILITHYLYSRYTTWNFIKLMVLEPSKFRWSILAH